MNKQRGNCLNPMMTIVGQLVLALLKLILWWHYYPQLKVCIPDNGIQAALVSCCKIFTALCFCKYTVMCVTQKIKVIQCNVI